MTCGVCDACQAKNFGECEDMRMIGFDPRTPGAYAEYVRAQATWCFRVPDSISFDDAATVEPLAVGLKAFREAEVAVGEGVLVIGAGPIGLAVVKWARFFGVTRIGVSEIAPRRLARAETAGATVLIDAAQHSDPVAAFRQLTGHSPAVIFECVGRPILQHLFDIAPQKARLIMVGTCLEPEQVTVALGAMKSLRVSFAFGYDPGDFQLVLELFSSGRVTSEPLISETISLDQVPDLFQSLLKPNDECKVVINP
jgi:(R,R)-butanediol dehydrogenase/meso-butanediol dehydrogenase/diacetyl reductase